MQNNGNYAAHAAIWDFGGIDRRDDFEYWREKAESYGRKVLIPFCALGECGAYLAQRGFQVTAFDITPEMIAEGKKRFSDIAGLQLYTADVTDFCFYSLQADFCFISGDFGHIHTLDKVKCALQCICAHLREGGGLVIETELPPIQSVTMPPQAFYPINQVYADKKVWKIGSGRTDVETGRRYISQTVFIEDLNGIVSQFDHSFYLQNYAREEWLNALKECGLKVKSEYSGRGHSSWNRGEGEYCIEAIKKKTPATGKCFEEENENEEF